jgi:Co/Zn/Cd efflux system component
VFLAIRTGHNGARNTSAGQGTQQNNGRNQRLSLARGPAPGPPAGARPSAPSSRAVGTTGSLTKAAFLSARNDALANVAIIAVGLVTAFLWASAWPDLIVGLGNAALNADAASEVWQTARTEHRTAQP